MHDTSLSKIESVSSFLLRFCSASSLDLQHQLRPCLAQPYQSALNVLDFCNAESPLTIEAIAHQTQLSKASSSPSELCLVTGYMWRASHATYTHQTQLSKASVRQVLKVLESVG